MTHLGSLTDEELIARVRVSQVATAMEREIARRLARAVDEIESLELELEEERNRE